MLRDKAIIALAIAETLVWAASFYVYPAMILGVGGLILLSILFTSAPSADA